MRRAWYARAVALALALAALFAARASAQELPGVERFSPGLARLSALLADGGELGVTATLSVDDAFYARDLSALSELLSSAILRYDGGAGADRLRIIRGGEALLDATLWPSGALALNGRAYALPEGTQNPLNAALPDGGALDLGALLSAPVFERAPLAQVAALLASLRPGDALPGGLIVARAFTLTQTFSDDGLRLTRVDLSGAVGFPSKAPYEVSGFLRQPGGRAPKDTFEITAARDEDNAFTLTYASTRSSETIRRDKQGVASVETTLRSDGRLAGYRIDSRLTVRLKNEWTADETGLSERITLSAHLGHTDRTPGRQMRRLNDLSGDLRATLALSTSEGAEQIALADDASLSVVMDGNDFLSGSLHADVSAGEGMATLFAEPEAERREPLSGEALNALLEDAFARLVSGLYAQLGEDALARIREGIAFAR